ncbi:MAG: hypothetical protein DIJKHBIC_00038 [Thermoanaerobaculia bacterium]|nr:hypothetical protein [Thermoanaerobaculia bacterium]
MTYGVPDGLGRGGGGGQQESGFAGITAICRPLPPDYRHITATISGGPGAYEMPALTVSHQPIRYPSNLLRDVAPRAVPSDPRVW